jgi:hypothetical protein
VGVPLMRMINVITRIFVFGGEVIAGHRSIERGRRQKLHLQLVGGPMQMAGGMWSLSSRPFATSKTEGVK